MDGGPEVRRVQVSKMEIWYRFPKFVLGFIAASIIFSWMLVTMGSAGDVMIDQGVLRGFFRPIREWFFILAFASIGLASNFRAMAHYLKGGKPLILYVCGQSLNLLSHQLPDITRLDLVPATTVEFQV